jgi:hypothetical protein
MLLFLKKLPGNALFSAELFKLGWYSGMQKGIENFVFRPKMAIFLRAGMKEGGLPLALAFQYLIPMI